MKRRLTALLAVALLSVATTAFAADASASLAAETDAASVTEASTSMLGTIPHGDFGTATEYRNGVFPQDADRLVMVSEINGGMSAWLLIPEGERAEAYYGMAVRFRPGEKLGEYEFAGDGADGNVEPSYGYALRAVYAPAELTVIGPELYGEVLERSDTAIVLSAYYGAEPESEAASFAVTLTPQTVMLGTIGTGATCGVIYDPQTREALACFEAHG